jgi:hypothetical protein
VAPPTPQNFHNESEILSLSNTSVFPWLAKLSTRYQRYKVKGMVFQYRSTSTDFNNSGTVAIAVNYNATERAYSNMPAVLNSQFACSAKPSVSFYAPVECDPKSHPDGYYIRHENEVDSLTDIRMSSIGRLNIVTSGLTLPEGTVLGELWVTYEVELISPYLGSDTEVASNLVKANKTYNDLTFTWDTANITNSDVSRMPFIKLRGDPRVGEHDLQLFTFATDANFTRPTLQATFQTGTKTFFIELECSTAGYICDWMPDPSGAQPGGNDATILWYDVTVNHGGNTLGSYTHRAIVDFKPGQYFTPPAQGLQSASGTGPLLMKLTVVKAESGR